MKNKRLVIFIIAILIVSIICLFINVCYKALSNLYDNKIFSDISDFEFLEPYETSNQLLHDKYLEDLNPSEAYVSCVEYEGKTYCIYAYIFNSSDEAYAYIKRSSGEWDAKQRSCDYFKFSRYFWGSRFWAYNENFA